MKFVVLAICVVVGVALGESADDQNVDVVNSQNQPQAQDRAFELSRKSRQLFGTAYPYGGGLTQGAYPYPVGTGVSAYSGYAGYPTTGLGFNSGQYSTALYGGGPYAGSYGSGVYGGGLYGANIYGSGGYGGGVYGGSGLGYGGYGGFGGYNQYVNDPYSAITTRAYVPSVYRRPF